ncbi:hypothetical protein BLOT_008594 [Blomia tropicalis]|nr:hypothetical protein BLOT_008594 [Blomia tropicalis]
MVQYTVNISEDKKYLVADLKQCRQHLDRLLLVRSLKSSSSEIAKLTLERESLNENMNKILIKWKEEWKIILSFIPDFMTKILEILESNSNGIINVEDVIFGMTMEFIRCVTLCISPKRIGRYWPTDVKWLPRIVEWLEQCLSLDKCSNWSNLYVLALWLSSAVRTPFDLNRFDHEIVKSNDGTQNHTMQHRIDYAIRSIVTDHSLLPVVHLLAGGFYSRPDIIRTSSRLEQFVGLLLQKLQNQSTVYEQVCCLRIFATLMKVVDRETIHSLVEQIMEPMFDLVKSEHELIAKLSIKILGRSALTRIRPRLFKWRYSCGTRIISTPKSSELKEIGRSSLYSSNEFNIDQADDNEEEEFDIEDLPTNFETVIQIFLHHLNHQSSIVRFSIAKYLASICSRLPYNFSEEILTYIIEDLCSEAQDDTAWHGACLALAEFVRRGYVRIDRMKQIVDVVQRALFYEHIKGSFSLGTHVRDSAAYICWSMARAYDPRLIGQFVVSHLAPLLICVVCFDRQLNCRRAASAVIQELSGRTQRFPNWIDVISRTEFHDLSLLEHTYLELGVHFATYEEFRSSIIQHLCVNKIIYWDPTIRRLAAKTLGLICGKLNFSISNSEDALKLLELALGPDLNGRHGSIQAIAHLIKYDNKLDPTDVKIESIIQELTVRNLFVGIGGDLMRESCMLLMKEYFRRQKQLPNSSLEYKTTWINLMLNTLTTETAFVQDQIIETVPAFIEITFNDASTCEPFLKTLVSIIENQCVQYHSISNICRSLMKLNLKTLSFEWLKRFVEAISNFINKVFDNPLRNSETVADAISTMVRLIDFNSELWSLDLFQILIRCLDDHTITNKGDVGLFVRIAAIKSIDPIDNGLLSKLDSHSLLRIIQLITSEAVFHRKKSFALSIEKLNLISKWKNLPNDVLPADIIQILNNFGSIETCSNDMDEGWDKNVEQYKQLLKLFSCDRLTYNLWPGIVCVMQDPGFQSSIKLIIRYLCELKPLEREQVLKTFLQFFRDHSKDIRLSIPCLISAKQLLLQVPTTVEFQLEIAELSWMTCHGSLNPKKYIFAIDVFCSLIPLETEKKNQNLNNSFRYLYVLLGHRFPRVRSYTATELFTSLLSIDDADHMESLFEVTEILQQTDWLNLEDSKQSRVRISNLIKSMSV